MGVGHAAAAALRLPLVPTASPPPCRPPSVSSGEAEHFVTVSRARPPGCISSSALCRPRTAALGPGLWGAPPAPFPLLPPLPLLPKGLPKPSSPCPPRVVKEKGREASTSHAAGGGRGPRRPLGSSVSTLRTVAAPSAGHSLGSGGSLDCHTVHPPGAPVPAPLGPGPAQLPCGGFSPLPWESPLAISALLAPPPAPHWGRC